MTFPIFVEIFAKKGWVGRHPILTPLRFGPIAWLSVMRVRVERLFSEMGLLLSGLRSWLKQDAVEAMLLLRTSMI